MLPGSSTPRQTVNIHAYRDLLVSVTDSIPVAVPVQSPRL